MSLPLSHTHKALIYRTFLAEGWVSFKEVKLGKVIKDIYANQILTPTILFEMYLFNETGQCNSVWTSNQFPHFSFLAHTHLRKQLYCINCKIPTHFLLTLVRM